ARLGVSSDEGAHPLDELHGRQLAGFGVRIVLVHHHETHGRLLTVSECGAARAARIRATKGPRLDRRGWRYFCKRRNILINFSVNRRLVGVDSLIDGGGVTVRSGVVATARVTHGHDAGHGRTRRASRIFGPMRTPTVSLVF